jgi:membrane protein implicated in regulation of membrane protease activity
VCAEPQWVCRAYPGCVSAPRPSRPQGDALLRVGAVLPFLVGQEPLPLLAYLLALLAPLGLGVVLVALWRRARSRRVRLAAASDAEGASDVQPR